MVLRIHGASDAMLQALAAAQAWRIDLGIPALEPAPAGVVVGDRPRDAAPIALKAWRDAVAVTRLPDGRVRGLDFDPLALGIDLDAYEQWRRRAPSQRPSGPLDEQPERRDVAVTVLAWEAGLEEIMHLPLAGRWAARVDSALLVDQVTRRDPHRYVDVLLAFAANALPRIS